MVSNWPEEIGTTIDPADPSIVPVQTLRDVIEAWATNPERKGLGADGEVCGRETRGLLQRRPVRTTRQLVTLIGKESNHLKEAQVGIMGRDEILNEYPDPERDPWQHLVLPAIEILGSSKVAEQAGLNRRTVNRAVRGTSARRKTRNRIAEAAKALVSERGDTPLETDAARSDADGILGEGRGASVRRMWIPPRRKTPGDEVL